MSHEPSSPSPSTAAVVLEEEALLERVREALEHARRRRAARSVPRSADAEIRALRDEAATASEADLPSLLHDLAVRQRLAARSPAAPLPDPSAPYVAHLRVDEGRGPEDYLLGHVPFFDSAGDVRVVDWRIAPVARIFYRYREGEAYEEVFPGRTAEGTVLARRIVVIEDGRLARIVGDSLLLERDAAGHWMERDRGAFALQAGGSGSAARPGILGVGVGAEPRIRTAVVTALLDPDQYAAVSAPPDRPLMILGSAGSGKTTVALHRLAHVSAVSPRTHPLDEAKVVVPEEGLARLSRRLLEPLGVGPGRVSTIDEWAKRLAREVFGKIPKLAPETPPLVVGLKRHAALFRAIDERFPLGRGGSTRLPRLRRTLLELLTDRGFLESVVAGAAGDLPTTAIDETLRHAVRQLDDSAERELAGISDRERARPLDERGLVEDTPDEVGGTLDLEDLPILLHLHARRARLGARPIAVLVLDEAEDFSLFELSVLGSLVRDQGSVTLAGDEAQQTATSFAGWSESLAILGASGAETIRLPTSYRCPRPVAELARRLLGVLAPERSAAPAREGAPVGVFRMPTESQAHLFLAGAIRDLVERERGASVGVIAATPESARRFHALLGDLPEARLVVDGEFTFEPGVDVTDVDEVKGLEFDYVVVPDATAAAYPATNDARRRLHVAVTRASHQLWIVAGGPASPLLAGE